MVETYAQSAARLLSRMDERKKLVQFPQTIEGRILLRREMAKGQDVEGRNFDGEAALLRQVGLKVEGRRDEYA